MKYVFLSNKNINNYLLYLEQALTEEPDLMMVKNIDAQAIKNCFADNFYRKTKSILAMDGNNVIGRLEYHFYGCLQDGYRMAYVDWVYVLPNYRKRGIAKKMFEKFLQQCKRHDIDQYYLITAQNPCAQAFYATFDGVEIVNYPILRKNLKQ